MFSLFSKVLKYVWPVMMKRRGVLVFIFSIFTIRALLDQVLIPVIFKKIVDLFSTPVVDRALVEDDLIKLFIVIAVVHLAGFFAGRTIKFSIFRFAIATIKELRDFTFKRVTQNSHSFFINTFSGSLVTKARRFAFGFESAFDLFVYDFYKFFVVMVGIFFVLFNESSEIAFIFLAWVPIHIFFTILMIRRKFVFDLAEATQDSAISGRLADVFGNISAVKFFARREDEIESFGEYTTEGAKRSKVAWFMEGKIDLLQHSLIIFIDLLALFVMIKLWLAGKISTGTVVLVHSYILVISQYLWRLANSMSKFMKSVSDMKEMVDIFELAPDILDPENPEKSKMLIGEVLFDDVTFKYKNNQEVFTNFRLHIKPGEKVGLVGHSGAGKSTITHLLLRLVDITGGAIKIDGQDIRNVTQDDLRRAVSYVPQEPVLFHRTIKENIAYPNPKASDSEIFEAAKKAHAHEFISKLQKGYDTFVGERGVKLSGGERQRVAIARAMLKNSPILVLDEATSSLDSISEKYIQDAFNELMKGKTAIVIAHRLSTIQKMDRIIVLDNGKIVEEGTHKELLKKKGFYANLWEHQTGGFLE